MSLITIAAADIAEFHPLNGEVPAKARLYANRSFKTSEGVFVAAGSEALPEFYQEFDLTLNGDIIRIEAGTAYATTNSDQPSATYNLWLYDDNDTPIGRGPVLSAQRIFPDNPVTTWDTVTELSKGVQLHDKPTWLSSAEQARLYGNILSGALKSNATIIGVSKLDVNPADFANPIAVGPNSPLVTNLAAPGTLGKIKTDVAPSDSANPVAVGNNSPRVGKDLALDYGNSFATAVTAIGANQTDLEVTAPITESADRTLPRNASLEIRSSGLVNVASGKTLHVGNFQDPGDRQVFALADATAKVVFDQGCVNRFNPAWFSGSAEGTDYTNAINNCIQSISNNGGGIIEVPDGNFLTAGGHVLPVGTIIRGRGNFGTGGSFGTVLKMSSAGSFMFKIGELTSGVRIHDLSLDGDSKATNGIYLEGSYPNTSYDIEIARCAAVRCVDGIRLNALDGSWQVEGFNIRKTIFVGNTHAGLRHNTTNGSSILDTPMFFVPDNGYGVYIDNAGTMSMYNPQFAGQGSAPTPYVAGEPAAGAAEGCIFVAGQVISLDIFNSQDEKFRDFLRHTYAFGFAGGPINIYGGAIQSLIRLEGQVSLNITGGKYWRRLIRDNASGSGLVRANGYSLFPTDLNGTAGNTSLGDTFTGSTVLVDENDSELGGRTHRLPTSFIKTAASFATPATEGIVKAFNENIGAFVNQVGYQWGQIAAGVPINTYSLGRGSDGRTKITGTQTGFTGYDFDADISTLALTRGKTTAAQITANKNDYDPGGIGYRQRWNSDATRNVTGFFPSNGSNNALIDGFEFLIINVGSFDIVLQHENAGSAAAHRFNNATGADIILSPNQQALAIYDGTTARWRVVLKNIPRQRSFVTADVPNLTNTMAVITGLTANLLAGHRYTGELIVKCNNSTAAEGIQFDFNGGTATMTSFIASLGLITSGTVVPVTLVSSALATALKYTTITGETWFSIKFSFVCNAAGTFIPRFAEGVAHTSGTATVSANSWMKVEEMN
jgi:hypothetical protein